MEWISSCLDPFRSCMGLSDDTESSADQQQQQHQQTERTPLLTGNDSSEPSTRREKGLAVILLDGEGDMFNFSAIARGFEGGLETANSLHLRTVEYLSQQPSLAMRHEIMCYVVYGREGRITTMIDAGGIGRQLKGFIEGFNSSPQPFFMVEVVSGGGATESKMQDCDVVLLGGLHLASRASALRALDDATKRKVKLVHTITIAPVYEELGFPISDHLKELFGDHDLGAFLCSGNVKDKKTGRHTAPSDMIVPSSDRLSSLMSSPKICESAENDYSRTTSPPSPPISKIKRSSTAPPEIYVPPSPRSPTALLDGSICSDIVPDLRFSRPHPCNEYYLSPRGCQRSDCPYSHEYPFTAEEWKAYPRFVKSKPCLKAKAGGSVNACPYGAEDCFYGHHCPYKWNECKWGDACHFDQAGLPHADQI